MENYPRPRENQSPSLTPSPNSSNGSCGSGFPHPSPPVNPVPITRSEPNNPYPTTFVQANTSSFKKVVQMLTGSSETAKLAAAARPEPPPKNPIPPIKSGHVKKSSKLYERRNGLKSFKISPPIPALGRESGFHPSPRKPELLSPSVLDFPNLSLSPVTPLLTDPFNRYPHGPGNVSPNLDSEAEEKAIAGKGFYLHSSPLGLEPRLLPLFPTTSPGSQVLRPKPSSNE